MRKALQLWLLGVVYAASTLVLVQPFYRDDAVARIASPNVSIRAKQPLEAALPAEAQAPAKRANTVASAAPSIRNKDELVQVAGYTAVARSLPTVSAPVLAGYPVGRPFRVISRERGFVRVQDLESGQFGWIAEASLAPYTGEHPQPQVPVQVAVQEPPQPEATVARTKVAGVNTSTRSNALVPRLTKASDGALVKQPEAQPKEVAVRQADDLSAIMQRAFAAAH
jgi:hypothetical protein